VIDNGDSEDYRYTPPPETKAPRKEVNSCLDICSCCSIVYLSVILQVIFGTFIGSYHVSPNATILDFLGTIIGIIGLGGFIVWWTIIKKRKL